MATGSRALRQRTNQIEPVAFPSRELEFEFRPGSHLFRCGNSLPASSRGNPQNAQHRVFWRGCSVSVSIDLARSRSLDPNCGECLRWLFLGCPLTARAVNPVNIRYAVRADRDAGQSRRDLDHGVVSEYGDPAFLGYGLTALGPISATGSSASGPGGTHNTSSGVLLFSSDR